MAKAVARIGQGKPLRPAWVCAQVGHGYGEAMSWQNDGETWAEVVHRCGSGAPLGLSMERPNRLTPRHDVAAVARGDRGGTEQGEAAMVPGGWVCGTSMARPWLRLRDFALACGFSAFRGHA